MQKNRWEIPAEMDRPRYSLVQILLHWAVVGLVTVQWLTYDAIARTHSSLMRPKPIDLLEHSIHTWVGILIGVLMVGRLGLRIHRRRTVPRVEWKDRIAALVHSGLYIALLAQAATGFVTRYLWGGAGLAHVWIWKAILALLVLHVLGAAYHLVRRDGVFGRMLPGSQATTNGR
jgi:cytochrome b561